MTGSLQEPLSGPDRTTGLAARAGATSLLYAALCCPFRCRRHNRRCRAAGPSAVGHGRIVATAADVPIRGEEVRDGRCRGLGTSHGDRGVGRVGEGAVLRAWSGGGDGVVKPFGTADACVGPGQPRCSRTLGAGAELPPQAGNRHVVAQADDVGTADGRLQPRPQQVGGWRCREYPGTRSAGCGWRTSS
jgi:hypothetical protein